MQEITKNKRTHILILRDKREFNITQEQYANIRLDREDKKRYDPFTLKDVDSGEILFDGEIGDIKEFKERKIDKNIAGRRYFCDFGTRHPLTEKCNCMKKFDTVPQLYKQRLKEMGYKVNYSNDITREMQTRYLQKYK